jgi:hypothetical protein
MLTRTNLILGTLGALALLACASKDKAEPPPPPPAAPPPVAAAPTPILSKTVAENTATMTATVVAIDQKKRMVTLKGPDGKTTTIHVGDQVQNLPQVKKGDQVVVTYYESLAYDVFEKGAVKRGVTMAEGAARAEPGEMPAALGARAVTVTAKITAIDKQNGTVTLKGPQGKLKTVKVQDPSKLDLVKVGDHVSITYTEALAIAVERSPKTAKNK